MGVGGGGAEASTLHRNFNISLLHYTRRKSVIFFTKYSIFIVDVKSGRFMSQSGRAGDEPKKRESPAKSGRVGITALCSVELLLLTLL